MRHSKSSCPVLQRMLILTPARMWRLGYPNARSGLKRHSLCESSSLGLYEMPTPTSNPIGFAPAIIPERSRERHGSQSS
jgi:hypothetical protein